MNSDYLSSIMTMNDDEFYELSNLVNDMLAGVKFIPNEGAQTDAYLSKADVLLYGGAAGGGKSGLLIGLGLSQHEKTLILRPSYTDLYALTEDAIRLNGTRQGFTGGTRPRLKTTDNRVIEFGAIGDNPESWQGQPHDLLGFDEVTQYKERDFVFLQTWVRSVKSGQRCRVVATSNPPTSSTGDWVIGYWRPWLDPTYHNPAKHGELRWVVTDPDGNDMWVDDNTPITFAGRKDPVIPKSRTFIPAKLSDNPYLRDTSYASTLDALPEPLRSAMRDGNFMLSRTDQDNQVIPTSWIRASQARWRVAQGKERQPMAAIGADVSCGGKDDTVICPIRADLYMDKPTVAAGKDVPDGSDVAALIVKVRRNGCVVGVDMGGGYGGAPKVHLEDSGIEVVQYKGATSDTRLDKSKSLGFVNKRSGSYWRLREMLDPDQDGGSTIMLFDDPELLSDLASLTYETVRYNNRLCIKVIPKDKLKKELGRSTNKGDAVVIAVDTYHKAQKKITNESMRRNGGLKAKLGYEERKRRR